MTDNHNNSYGYPYTYGDYLEAEEALQNFQIYFRTYGLTLLVMLSVMLSQTQMAQAFGKKSPTTSPPANTPPAKTPPANTPPANTPPPAPGGLLSKIDENANCVVHFWYYFLCTLVGVTTENLTLFSVLVAIPLYLFGKKK
jgi:hypothetical protein